MFQVSSQSFYIQPFERKPSPLSPRNPNACPRFSAPMISESKGRSKGKHNDKTRPLQNPLLRRKPEQLQDQRRQVFLKKVRQSGDAKKWEERSDRILRQQYLAEQKTWEHDQALSAPEAAPVSEDEQDEPRAQDGEENGEVEMVDMIMSQEDQEFEALVSLLQDQRAEGGGHQEAANEYGSDEEDYDYDQLFMDIMPDEKQPQSRSTEGGVPALEAEQDMDLSVG